VAGDAPADDHPGSEEAVIGPYRIPLIGGPSDGADITIVGGVQWVETAEVGTLRVACYNVVDGVGLYRRTRIRQLF